MIPDPIERGEAAAERAYDELCQPGDLLRCYQCGTIFDAEKEGGTLSPDPHAMPVCGPCFAAGAREFDLRTMSVPLP